MKTRLLFVCATMTALGCQSPAPPSAAAHSPENDAREVEALLLRWYDASVRHDSAGYADAMLPDFFIIEDTTVYDKTALTQGVVASFAMGTDRSTLYDFKTAVSGDVAWSTFRNDEVWTPNGGKPESPRRFWESVVFRRMDGRWFLERYHATRINREPAL